MGMAYVCIRQTHLPNAVLVVDHFHVVKGFQENLNAEKNEVSHLNEALALRKRTR